jgi:hypothetical protein
MGEASLVTSNKPRVSQRRPTKRLTAEDIGSMLRWRAEGLTQAAIAQRLDCDQAAVNRWLAKLTDSTETAKSFLRGSALRMAENIVKKGRAADHVAALKGLSVLTEERSAGLVVQIGIKDSDVSISLSPGEGDTRERRSAETLAITTGSDTASSVN